MNNKIYTIESRENSYLEVTKEYFKLSDRQMYDVIQEAFNHFIENFHYSTFTYWFDSRSLYFMAIDDAVLIEMMLTYDFTKCDEIVCKS